MAKVHGKRFLLNEPGFEGLGAVVAEIEDTRDWKENCNRDGKPLTADTSEYDIGPKDTLQFADCYRNTAFNLCIENEEEYRNTLLKVDKMVEALLELRHGLEIEYDLFQTRKTYIKSLPKGKENESNPKLGSPE